MTSSETPVAPWQLDGEAVIVLTKCPAFRPPLPHALQRLGTVVVVAAARWRETPVGPYIELAVAVPARLGLRFGWCIVTMAATSADARVAGVINWGFPRVLASLGWGPTPGGGIDIAWLERDLRMRAVLGRRSLPVLLPLRALQHRSDGQVIVPARARGWARPARVTLKVPADDPLAPLAGRHRGVHVGGLQLNVRPAHHAVGVRATLLAPLQAPDVAT
jgi:hypothetical protein